MSTMLSPLLKAATKSVAIQLALITKRQGFTVDYYYPILKRGVYGTDDADISYSDTPTKSQLNIVSGLFSKRFQSDFSLDPFSSDENRVYFAVADSIPDDTKAIVHMGPDNYFTFRVKYIEMVYAETTPIWKIGKLVPIQ